MTNWKKFSHKTLVALAAVRGVLAKPIYALIALAIAFFFALLIFFIINNAFYGSLLLSRLPLPDKIGVVGSMITQMSVEFFTTANGLLILLVSLLQGISITLLIFTIRRNQKNDRETTKQLGTSGFAAIAAAIGLGCVPCGTSLLLPIVTIFFSGSAVATAISTVSIIILIIALALSLYSIFRLGQIAHIYLSEEKLQKETQ